MAVMLPTDNLVHDGVFEVLQWLLFLSAVLPNPAVSTGW